MSASWPGLLLALALPWIIGALWLRLLLPQRLPVGGTAIVLGYGYLGGMMGLAALMLAMDALGLGVGFGPVAFSMFMLGLPAGWLLWRRGRPDPAAAAYDASGALNNRSLSNAWSSQPRWPLALSAALLLLVMARFLSLTLEVLWQPLYPWDAWMSWSWVARQWFEMGALGDIAPTRHPRTVPLLQTWTAMAWGHWHDTVINLPWVLAGIALVLGIYGQLRHIGSEPLLALLAVYLVASLPLLNNHIALAGYADIWLTLAFTLGLIALANAMVSAERWQWTLAVVCLALTLAIKVSAPLYLVPLAAALFLYLAPRWLSVGAITLAAVFAVTVYLAGGIDLHLGPLGRLALTTEHMELPLVGSGGIRAGHERGLQTYTPVGWAFAQSLFVLGNWHLLWWVALFLPLGLFSNALRRSPYTVLTLTLAGVVAIFWLAYGFSDHGGAQDFTSINRMLLGVAPVISFSLFWALAYLRTQRDPRADRRQRR